MTLTRRQVSKLNKVLAMVQEILNQADNEQKVTIKTKSRKRTTRAGSKPRTTRRTPVQAAKMRADILAKRANGVSASTLAQKYGVSTAYIYMIKA